MKRRLGNGGRVDGVWTKARDWIGEVTESNAKDLARHPARHFEDLKAMLPGDYQDRSIEEQFLTALGFALAKAITLTSDWTFEFLLLEEDNFRESDGVWSVVSPDRGTFFYPIGALYQDYFKKTPFSGLYAEAIYSGKFPSNPPESFTEWEITEMPNWFSERN